MGDQGTPLAADLLTHMRAIDCPTTHGRPGNADAHESGAVQPITFSSRKAPSSSCEAQGHQKEMGLYLPADRRRLAAAMLCIPAGSEDSVGTLCFLCLFCLSPGRPGTNSHPTTVTTVVISSLGHWQCALHVYWGLPCPSPSSVGSLQAPGGQET